MLPFSSKHGFSLLFALSLLLTHGQSTGFADETKAPANPAQAAPAPISISRWHGFAKEDFIVGKRKCLLVRPQTAAPGNPWIWRTEFFGHEPQADIALLQNGFHVAYIDVQNLYGAPVALDAMSEFYEFLTKTEKLSSKPVLEGFSRGGLFALNWAARYPDRVAALYLDAPVCDFKSWPGCKGSSKAQSADDWKRLLAAYQMSEAEALAYKGNPVDNLAPLAKANIPIIAVIGEADDIVPPSENIDLLASRYKALGGLIQIIRKPGVNHHPHSLKDPTPIVDFVLKEVKVKKKTTNRENIKMDRF